MINIINYIMISHIQMHFALHKIMDNLIMLLMVRMVIKIMLHSFNFHQMLHQLNKHQLIEHIISKTKVELQEQYQFLSHQLNKS